MVTVMIQVEAKIGIKAEKQGKTAKKLKQGRSPIPVVILVDIYSLITMTGIKCPLVYL